MKQFKTEKASKLVDQINRAIAIAHNFYHSTGHKMVNWHDITKASDCYRGNEVPAYTNTQWYLNEIGGHYFLFEINRKERPSISIRQNTNQQITIELPAGITADELETVLDQVTDDLEEVNAHLQHRIRQNIADEMQKEIRELTQQVKEKRSQLDKLLQNGNGN